MPRLTLRKRSTSLRGRVVASCQPALDRADGTGIALQRHMPSLHRPAYLVLSVYALFRFSGCTAELRPETPHEAREERREEHRRERHEEHEEHEHHEHHEHHDD